MIVNWTDIVAECGNYRDGFVAVFRRYEGQSTDERTAQGRIVKVTASSFARHLGIAQQTFSRWIKLAEVPSAGTTPRSAKDLTRDVTRAARHEPEAVVAGVMAAPEATQDRIFHELKLARAERPGGVLEGADRSPAHRQAVKAALNESLVDPVNRWASKTRIAGVPDILDGLTEDLQDATAKDLLTGELFAEIDAAHDRFAIALAEARLALGVTR